MFEKAAETILSHPRVKKLFSEKVRMQLKFLYPLQEEGELCKSFYKKKLGLALKIFLAGLFFAGILIYNEKEEPMLQGNRIYRDEDISKTREVRLRAKSASEKEKSYDFSYAVGGQICKPEEIEQKAEQFEKGCETLILGENESLEQIKTSLVLKESYEGYPMVFSWACNPYALIEEDGTVHNEDLEQKEYAVLTVCMSYEETEYEYSFPVCVCPGDLTPSQAWKKEVLQAVKKADEEQKYTDSLILPEEVAGKAIIYSEPGNGGNWYYLLFPVMTAVLVFFVKDKDLKKLSLLRRRQMELKYPEFVSKFQLLLGAGMTVRGVLFRLSEDHSLGEELGQELQLLVRDMKNGLPGKDALDHFGKRSQNPLYMRFSALLIQNMKKGTSDLLPMLEKESAEAFLLRKNHAKQLGEEAGTKLLGPMIIQLLIVMMVIIVPAFLSFQL